jgi:hypothetical protein
MDEGDLLAPAGASRESQGESFTHGEILRSPRAGCGRVEARGLVDGDQPAVLEEDLDEGKRRR